MLDCGLGILGFKLLVSLKSLSFLICRKWGSIYFTKGELKISLEM